MCFHSRKKHAKGKSQKSGVCNSSKVEARSELVRLRTLSKEGFRCRLIALQFLQQLCLNISNCLPIRCHTTATFTMQAVSVAAFAQNCTKTCAHLPSARKKIRSRLLALQLATIALAALMALQQLHVCRMLHNGSFHNPGSERCDPRTSTLSKEGFRGMLIALQLFSNSILNISNCMPITCHTTATSTTQAVKIKAIAQDCTKTCAHLPEART